MQGIRHGKIRDAGEEPPSAPTPPPSPPMGDDGRYGSEIAEQIIIGE